MSRIVNPGVFFIFGFSGIAPHSDFLELVNEFHPAGFLLLEGNFQDTDQLVSLTSRLRSLVDGHCIIAVDQEPGRVQRFKTGFPESKKPADYLKDGSTDTFREWCCDTSEILRSTGIDMNLAPVVDMLPANRDYPVLGDRAFSDIPEIVTRYARVLIEEHKRKSVLTCAKHFPGLGSAVNDPHRALAVSDETAERFRNHHWRSFAEAVKHGVHAVMTTHLLAKAIDDSQCATYSAKTVRHLRRDIGHSGPIITDDLIMSGAGEEERIGQAALNAIESGHNFVIISQNIALQRKALETVARELDEDESLARAAVENEKSIEKISHEF